VANYGGGGLMASDPGGVSILLGNRDGTFTSGGMLPVGRYPAHLAAADVNGDGKLDLVVATTRDGSHGALAVLPGNGDGTFQAPTLINVPNPPQWVSILDVNGDGVPDIVEAGNNADVEVFYGNGDGTFQSGIPFPAGMNPVQIVVADFDGDGTPDLAVADYGSGSSGGGMTVILNNSQPAAGQSSSNRAPGRN
jgi:hypothetical protein